MALAGVLVYFIIDYNKYKQNIKSDLDKSKSDAAAAAKGVVDTEKLDRMANVKYVVDQVNRVNTDIYTAVTSNVDMTNDISSNVQNFQTKFNDLIYFTDPSSAGNFFPNSGRSYSLTEVPGSVNMLDVNVRNHIITTMGMTATNLHPLNSTKLCSLFGRCSEFPDANGNIVLRSMVDDVNSKIVMDAPTVEAAGAVSASSFSFASGSPASLSSAADGTMNISSSNKIVINTSDAAGNQKGQVILDPATNTVTITGSNIVLGGQGANTTVNGNLCVGSTCIAETNVQDLKNMRTKVTTSELDLNGKWTIKPGSGDALVFRDQTAAAGQDFRYAMVPGVFRNI